MTKEKKKEVDEKKKLRAKIEKHLAFDGGCWSQVDE